VTEIGKLALLAAVVLAALLAAVARGAAARDTVTIASNAKVAENAFPTLLGGFVSSRRPGETVTLEQDDCGPIPWHPVLTVKSADQGGWRGFANPDINSRYRARWRKTVSRVITIKARPQLNIVALDRGIRLQVLAFDFFDGRTALLERRDPATRKYHVVARTRLERAGAAGIYAATTGIFRVAIRGTVRARLPEGEARPCYTTGFSTPIRL
jgi:hypothetical protein